MKEKLLSYFEAFSNKDLDKLSEMFSNDVILTDWEIDVIGKDNVLKANKNIFDSVEAIQVHPRAFYGGDNAYAVEIEIMVTTDKVESLEVIDVITFDDKGLIDSVKAYKK